MFQPILEVERQEKPNEHFYTIRNDWHDVQLRVDLELNEIAKAIEIPFERVFKCTSVIGVCPKCIKTSFVKKKSSKKILKNKKKAPVLVRKRKPIDFTIQDLEAAAEEENDDYTEYFDPGDLL